MSSYKTPKSLLEVYWDKYSDDRKRLSDYLNRQLLENPAILMFIKKASWYLYQPYKWLFIVPVLVFSTVILSTCAILTSLILTPRLGGKFAVMWARVNSFFTPMTVKVKGLENITKKQSYVIVANHLSLYDIYVLYGWSGIDIRWVMKQELRKVPVIGLVCAVLQHIYIDRSDPEKAIESINRAKEKIINGTSIIFFPEGSRSHDGKLQPFKKGAFRLAADLDLPVLPVTLNGTREVLGKGTLNLHPGTAEMTIHEPVYPTGIDNEAVTDLMNASRAKIAGALSAKELS